LPQPGKPYTLPSPSSKRHLLVSSCGPAKSSANSSSPAACVPCGVCCACVAAQQRRGGVTRSGTTNWNSAQPAQCPLVTRRQTQNQPLATPNPANRHTRLVVHCTSTSPPWQGGTRGHCRQLHVCPCMRASQDVLVAALHAVQVASVVPSQHTQGIVASTTPPVNMCWASHSCAGAPSAASTNSSTPRMLNLRPIPAVL
jgi:hypothetical protein